MPKFRYLLQQTLEERKFILFLNIIFNALNMYIYFNVTNYMQLFLGGTILTFVIYYAVYLMLKIIYYYVDSYKILQYDITFNNKRLIEKLESYIGYLSFKSDVRLISKYYEKATMYNTKITIDEFNSILQNTPVSEYKVVS